MSQPWKNCIVLSNIGERLSVQFFIFNIWIHDVAFTYWWVMGNYVMSFLNFVNFLCAALLHNFFCSHCQYHCGWLLKCAPSRKAEIVIIYIMCPIRSNDSWIVIWWKTMWNTKLWDNQSQAQSTLCDLWLLVSASISCFWTSIWKGSHVVFHRV